ncbi:MAG: beta-ketoacyl-ACP synthase [Nitrospirota bacterium]
MSRRVVITGMGCVSALGDDWATLKANLLKQKTATRVMPEWDKFVDLQTRLGAPVDHFQLPSHYTRRAARSMGRVSLLAVRASELAIQESGLIDNPVLTNGNTGIAYGSSAGSMDSLRIIGYILETGKMKGLTAATYIQSMSHTAAVNIGIFFKIRGRVIPTSSACTSGSQAIGYAYESIRYGKQKVMVAGGAEELSAFTAMIFDVLFATSTKNTTPQLTPSPFDKSRDGLVVGEGAATLILEEYEHARTRGAKIYAEIAGYGCNSDGMHITQPDAVSMAAVMRLSLQDAGLKEKEIGYINLHGTGTKHGDIAESMATNEVFSSAVPVSGVKGHFGHTLGASGALEAMITINMINEGWAVPNANLVEVDPDCAKIDFIIESARKISTQYSMSNNFAFGGINTSLIFRKTI